MSEHGCYVAPRGAKKRDAQWLDVDGVLDQIEAVLNDEAPVTSLRRLIEPFTCAQCKRVRCLCNIEE